MKSYKRIPNDFKQAVKHISSPHEIEVKNLETEREVWTILERGLFSQPIPDFKMVCDFLLESGFSFLYREAYFNALFLQHPVNQIKIFLAKLWEKRRINLPLLYMTGLSQEKEDGLVCIFKKNSAEAFNICQRLAAEGDSFGHAMLGSLYGYGEGVTKDIMRAIQHWEEAAKSGNMMAQFFLGWVHQEGMGVPKNLNRARVYYESSAKQGYSAAQTALGLYYQRGWAGIEKNIAIALHYYLLAGMQHYPPAQYNVGQIYQYGVGGVKKNEVVARYWYQYAASQGLLEARKKLGQVHPSMVPNLSALPSAICSHIENESQDISSNPLLLPSNHLVDSALLVYLNQLEEFIIDSRDLIKEDPIPTRLINDYLKANSIPLHIQLTLEQSFVILRKVIALTLRLSQIERLTASLPLIEIMVSLNDSLTLQKRMERFAIFYLTLSKKNNAKQGLDFTIIVFHMRHILLLINEFWQLKELTSVQKKCEEGLVILSHQLISIINKSTQPVPYQDIFLFLKANLAECSDKESSRYKAVCSMLEKMKATPSNDPLYLAIVNEEIKTPSLPVTRKATPVAYSTNQMRAEPKIKLLTWKAQLAELSLEDALVKAFSDSKVKATHKNRLFIIHSLLLEKQPLSYRGANSKFEDFTKRYLDLLARYLKSNPTLLEGELIDAIEMLLKIKSGTEKLNMTYILAVKPLFASCLSLVYLALAKKIGAREVEEVVHQIKIEKENLYKELGELQLQLKTKILQLPDDEIKQCNNELKPLEAEAKRINSEWSKYLGQITHFSFSPNPLKAQQRLEEIKAHIMMLTVDAAQLQQKLRNMKERWEILLPLYTRTFMASSSMQKLPMTLEPLEKYLRQLRNLLLQWTESLKSETPHQDVINFLKSSILEYVQHCAGYSEYPLFKTEDVSLRAYFQSTSHPTYAYARLRVKSFVEVCKKLSAKLSTQAFDALLNVIKEDHIFLSRSERDQQYDRIKEKVVTIYYDGKAERFYKTFTLIDCVILLSAIQQQKKKQPPSVFFTEGPPIPPVQETIVPFPTELAKRV